MAAFLREIDRRSRVLYFTGWWMFLQAAVFVVLMPFDDRTVLGIDTWIKPFKFCVSVGIFLWTVAWFLDALDVKERTRRAFGWTFSVLMIVEIGCIVLQGARGVRSHYNFATGFDASVFSTMGTVIALNSVVLFLLTIAFFVRAADRERAYIWGIRLGLVLILVGSAQGGLLVSNGSHAVGVPDGGPGLPLVNWTTEAGDLRIAHGVFLHGLQVLPFVGFLLARRSRWSVGGQLAALAVVTVIYSGTGALLLWQALQGRPLIGLG